MSNEHQGERRRDIDGLRAVAVLGVIAFHVLPTLLPGGFTGVDVFFVISGFVITRLIDGEIRCGQFTFRSFYQRRIRRIIPPLLIMSALTLTFFFAIFRPFNFKKLGQSALASSLFWANQYFRRQSGYFAGPVRERPLLHTWSLSVEEQFYFAWPALMWLGARFLKRRAVVGLVALVVLLSLMWSEHLARSLPNDAFYSTFGRAWELGLGALAAFSREAIDRLVNVRQIRTVSWGLPAIGVALIVYAFGFTKSGVFPGLHALPACGGTLLVIVANRTSQRGMDPISAALASQPVVYIGRLSYSLYLWHWPILCGVFLLEGNAPSKAALAVGAVFTVLAATLSYELLEVPLRRKGRANDFVIPTGKVLAVCAIGGLAIVSIGFASHKTEGFAGNVAGASSRPLSRDTLLMGTIPPCQRVGSGPVCAYESVEAARTVLVWGDSHASTIGRALRLSATARRVRIVVASKGACPPVAGFGVVSQQGVPQTDCEAFNSQVLEFVGTHNLAAVVIAGRWSLYQRTDLIADRPVGDFVLLTGAAGGGSKPVSVADAVGATISTRIPGQLPVLIIGQPPEFLLAPVNCALSRYAARLMVGRCDIAESKLRSWYQVREGLARLELPSMRVAFVDLLGRFCANSTCSGIDRQTGDVLYEDDNHIDAAGGDQIAGDLWMALNRLWAGNRGSASVGREVTERP
jgi:peptidoglycan/LPS O-acetylase OafA/YrhL